MIPVGNDMPAPVRFINARAPVRICDIGGWTDTWFAEHGAVCSIAVSPVAEVQVVARPAQGGVDPVVINAVDFGDRYAVIPGAPLPGRHPLIDAAVDEFGVPGGVGIEVTVHSDAPPGASMGTSAAVAVALVGALATLWREAVSPHEVARVAHQLEVERLGLQSGVQDQVAAAFGGLSVIEIEEYPRPLPQRLPVAVETQSELARRLLVVYLGRPHVSSAVHEAVIAELAGEGAASPRLQVLRDLAYAAGERLMAGDVEGFAETMRVSTEAQRALHPTLVSDEAEHLIGLARSHGSSGWKVNGAGGAGGSVTILAPADAGGRRALVDEIRSGSRGWRLIPVRISGSGLQVWER